MNNRRTRRKSSYSDQRYATVQERRDESLMDDDDNYVYSYKSASMDSARTDYSKSLSLGLGYDASVQGMIDSYQKSIGGKKHDRM